MSELSEDQVLPPEPEDFEFGKEALKKLYEKGEAGGINPLRWERVREQVIFSDLVEELVGKRSNIIRCPFHGGVSFYIYPPARGNCGYCFGCAGGGGKGTYDHIRFTSQLLNMSRMKALLWIEKHWELEPLPDIAPDEPEEEQTITVEFEDLASDYLRLARREIAASSDAQLAEEYIRIYFDAAQGKEAMPLARVLGREATRKILHRKLHA